MREGGLGGPPAEGPRLIVGGGRGDTAGTPDLALGRGGGAGLRLGELEGSAPALGIEGIPGRTPATLGGRELGGGGGCEPPTPLGLALGGDGVGPWGPAGGDDGLVDGRRGGEEGRVETRGGGVEGADEVELDLDTGFDGGRAGSLVKAGLGAAGGASRITSGAGSCSSAGSNDSSPSVDELAFEFCAKAAAEPAFFEPALFRAPEVF